MAKGLSSQFAKDRAKITAATPTPAPPTGTAGATEKRTINLGVDVGESVHQILAQHRGVTLSAIIETLLADFTAADPATQTKIIANATAIADQRRARR